jgi:hypothetical protein
MSKKMQQAFQRAATFRTRFAARRSAGTMSNQEHDLEQPGTPPDVQSVRAKSTRHRKMTADKWNQ